MINNIFAHPPNEDCRNCSERSIKGLALLDEICNCLLSENDLRTALAEITNLLKTRFEFSLCVITILNRKNGSDIH